MEQSSARDVGESVAEASGVVRAETLTRGADDATLELTRLLGVQARLGDARGGVILRDSGAGRVDVLAAWPDGLMSGGAAPGWIERAGQALGDVLARGKPLLEMAGDGGALVVVSLAPVGEGRAVGAFFLDRAIGSLPGGFQRAAVRLEQGVAVIGLHGLRMELGRMERRGGLLAGAVETGALVGSERRFAGAAMGVVNAVAARFDADRASLGMIGARRDGFVRVRAMSHTERVHRKMGLVGAIEAAMQECADQDEEVLACQEGPWTGAGVVDRAARELGERENVCVLSLPLRDREGVVGVLTVERKRDPGHPEGFASEEIEALRLIGNVAGARLAELEERDRWFGGRLALWGRRAGARLVGPEHTWIKLGAIVLASMLAFAIFGRGMETARGAFVIETVGERSVAAPFDGFVEAILVEVGDPVVAGETVLARLDDSTIRLELVEARAQARAMRQRAAAARGRGQIAEAQIAEAQADEGDARIGVLEHRMERAELVAPIDGVVVMGERARLVGSPVQMGRVLFEIAPLGAVRVVVAAPENRVGDLASGQRGWIAPASYPERRLPIVVERIEPVARATEEGNVFRVYATLEERPEWLRPGMEGVARIELGRASWAWIWGRDVLEWVRMRVWW